MTTLGLGLDLPALERAIACAVDASMAVPHEQRLRFVANWLKDHAEELERGRHGTAKATIEIDGLVTARLEPPVWRVASQWRRPVRCALASERAVRVSESAVLASAHVMAAVFWEKLGGKGPIASQADAGEAVPTPEAPGEGVLYKLSDATGELSVAEAGCGSALHLSLWDPTIRIGSLG